MMRMASRGRAVRKPKVTAAEKPVAPSEDQVQVALTEALHCLESMKPRGNLTVALEREWRAALSRKAAAKVREAEAATVRGALLTFSELQVHMADRCRPLRRYGGAVSGPGGVEVAGQGGAARPRPLGIRQVAEPPMLALLERQIEQLYNARNPQWRAIGPLGVWLWCAAVGSPGQS